MCTYHSFKFIISSLQSFKFNILKNQISSTMVRVHRTAYNISSVIIDYAISFYRFGVQAGFLEFTNRTVSFRPRKRSLSHILAARALRRSERLWHPLKLFLMIDKSIEQLVAPARPARCFFFFF